MISDGEFAHKPVLPEETLRLLLHDPDGVYLDGTAGLGGHSELICEKLSDKGRLVFADWDAGSLEIAKKRLERFSKKAIALHANYADAPAEAAKLGITGFDGALYDLGLSSWQLDAQRRGFSFKTGGPLDMRYDISRGITAGEIVNRWPHAQLADIIRRYGEDRFAGRIASFICRNREPNAITTAEQLAAIVEHAVPRAAWGRIHPATRTFQALRIAVNDELENLERALGGLDSLVKPGGRAVFITFHSLEDRLVKRALRAKAAQGGWTDLTKKPVEAGEAEQASNPRARSAKLRAAQRNTTQQG
ncbi:MAG: 16S rRNA (cytosine(1402)-N(4))-methyltransferase RsmH [Elusimicrobiales bacterium]|nr:16S rRNA (cytosine(1402)-N(4))-methyltransferase RsmH [Elusimicrobiales bacterium]